MGRNPSRIDWTVPHRITGPAWNFLQAVFTGCSFLQSFHLFWHRLDCSVDTCSTMALHKLQGNLYSCPSSSLFIALWFSHILLLLSPGAAAWHFLSFPKYFIKVLLISLTASDLASGQISLGSRWNWLCLTWGQTLASSHRTHPFSAPQQTFPHKPNASSCKGITW